MRMIVNLWRAPTQTRPGFTRGWAAKEVEKGRMTDAESAAFVERIRYGSLDGAAMQEASGLDFVIEAVSEDLGTKRAVFESLMAAGLPEASVLASNTSSISITKLSSGLPRPERFIGAP